MYNCVIKLMNMLVVVCVCLLTMRVVDYFITPEASRTHLCRCVRALRALKCAPAEAPSSQNTRTQRPPNVYCVCPRKKKKRAVVVATLTHKHRPPLSCLCFAWLKVARGAAGCCCSLLPAHMIISRVLYANEAAAAAAAAPQVCTTQRRTHRI